MVKIVEITTKSCPVCKMIAPMLVKAIEPFAQRVNFQVYDADSEVGSQYCKAYNIKGAPQFFFFNSNGDLIHRHSGAIALGEVRARINQILTDYEK